MASDGIRKHVRKLKLFMSKASSKKRLALDVRKGQWEVNLTKPGKGWDRVAARAARFLGRDDAGNTVVAVHNYSCMLLLDKEGATTLKAGDVVNLSFPFCTSEKVETAKAVVVGDVQAYDMAIAFTLELFDEPSWFPQPVLFEPTEDLGLHLVARCTSENKLIACLAIAKSADSGRWIGCTVDGSYVHGFGAFNIGDDGDVEVIGVTFTDPSRRDNPYKDSVVDVERWHAYLPWGTFRAVSLVESEEVAIRKAGFQRHLRYAMETPDTGVLYI